MEKLLQWSTAQESSDPEVRARAPAPDPKLLAQVLGADTGKDDITLMKEDISVLVCEDPQISIDDKLMALEDFEILVQNLDNANNISPMGIWPEIAKLYTYEGEESDEFRGLAALITGTAVQNNTKCQNDFVKIVGLDGMKKLVALVSKNNNFNVRARALYALSGLVGHHGELYKLFEESDGWKALSDSFAESFNADDKKDTKVLLRCLSLLKSLLYDEVISNIAEVKDENKEKDVNTEFQTEIVSKQDRFKTLADNKIVLSVSQHLSKNSHFDVNERIISVLSYISQNGYKFSTEESSIIHNALKDISKNEYNAKEVEYLESIL